MSSSHRAMFAAARVVMVSVALAGVALAAASAPAGPPACEPQWNPGMGFPGVASIAALVVFDDGSGPALHAAGPSNVPGLLNRWDGDAWVPIPNAPTNNDMRELAVFDDGQGSALFATGEFFTAGAVEVNNIARWDGVEWSPLGSGIGGFGLSLGVFDDGLGSGPALYVGGAFTSAGGIAAPGIARWDGIEWSALGAGVNGAVHAMTVFDDGRGPALYVGGTFSLAGGAPASNVARWDGAAWSGVGPGVPQSVRTLAVFDDGAGPRLHAAGFVTSPGGFPFIVSRFDGVSWAPLGTGFNGTIQAMTSFDDGGGAGAALYIAGDFGAIVVEGSDIPASRIARWNGSAWEPLGPGVSSSAMALAVFDDDGVPTLAVGGGFTNAGGVLSRGVGRWSGCVPDPTVPGDLDGNGFVDGADLGMLLGSWGEPGISDLDGDGTTDGADLGILLGGWS